MTDKEKIIKKAVKNGWDIDKAAEEIWGEETLGWDTGEKLFLDARYELMIFRNDFVKAFWKNAETVLYNDREGVYDLWQYHLQQMVLEENPLQYLRRFL